MKLISVSFACVFGLAMTCRASYRAAVFDGNTVGNADDEDAMDVVQSNLELYDAATKAAKEEDGAQIMVFPEWGLFGASGLFGMNIPAFSRAAIQPFCQPVGNSGDDLLTADDSFSIVRGLAAIAKEYQIVVVANVCEIFVTNDNSGEKLYNTEVAISETGMLLAKYRKMHPFLPRTFDTPPKQVVTFETSFGVEFGVFVCYDLLHSEPQKSIIHGLGVTQIPYSVAFFDFFLSQWFYSWWAQRNKATLLVANFNGGSRIFAGGDGGADDVVKRDGYTIATIYH